MNPFFTHTHYALLLLLPVFFLTPEVSGQKNIKYKDLYPLLKSRQFRDAKPILQEFLVQEPDHPNANLQMGYAFESFCKDADILTETNKVVDYADSARIYYQKAIQYIDDREVRKNDEYYEDYNRRDLRTGKFGIEVDNVHYDLEQQMESLEKYSQTVTALRTKFDRGIANYQDALEQFTGIHGQYASQNALLIQFDEALETVLEGIAVNFDSSQQYFNEYTRLLDQMETSQYNQLFSIVNIEGLADADTLAPDFYDHQVDLINFTKWVNDTKYDVVTTIIPLRESWNEKHDQLEQAFEMLASSADGSDVETVSLEDEKRKTALALDPYCLPVKLLDYQSANLAVQRKFKQTSATLFYDTIGLDTRISEWKELLYNQEDVQNAYRGLVEVTGPQEVARYAEFITTQYTSPEAFATYLKAQESSLTNFRETGKQKINELETAKLWIATEDMLIPVFLSDTASVDSVDLVYHTLLVLEDTSKNVLVSGIHRGEKETIFIGAANDYRKLINLEEFEITGKADSLVHGFSHKEIIPGTVALMHFQHAPEEAPLKGTLFYVLNGLVSWKKEVPITTEPRVEYDQEAEQLIVFQKGEGQTETQIGRAHV